MPSVDSTQSVRAYFRERGVVCFMTPNLEFSSAFEISEQLFATGLSWMWRSGPLHPEMEVAGSYLPARDWTLLNAETLEHWSAEWAEFDSDENKRYFYLIGFHLDDPELMLNSTIRFHKEREFAIDETGPIKVIIFQDGDSPVNYIFVPHKPILEVATLLSDWSVDKAHVDKVIDYKYLNLIKLELLIERNG